MTDGRAPSMRPGWREEPSPTRLAPDHPRRAEVLRRHARACAERSSTYVDPDTGLAVMTATSLAARDACCASGCRHCPWVDP